MESHCRRTLECNPEAWTAHNNLGGVLSSEGRLDEAAREYQTALRLKPSDAGAHSNLGIVFARLNRLNEAVAEYHAALALAPGNAKFWFNLGNALRAQRRNDEAVDAFSHAIEVNATERNWTTPHYEMGIILLELGRPAEAGHQAQIIVNLDSESIAGHYLMARAAAAIGRFDAATVEAATALEIARRAGQEKTIRQMQDLLDACKAGRLPTAPEL
jgi:tetratricopeptide (TPR) repeat protein